MFPEPVHRPVWDRRKYDYSSNHSDAAVEHFGLKKGAIRMDVYKVEAEATAITLMGRKERRGLSMSRVEPRTQTQCNVFMTFELFLNVPPEMIVDYFNAVDVASLYHIKEPRGLFAFANIQPGFPPQIIYQHIYLHPTGVEVYKGKLGIAFHNDYWQKTTLFWELLRQVDNFEKKK